MSGEPSERRAPGLRRIERPRLRAGGDPSRPRPILQVALDFVDLPRALEVAREAVAGGVDWIEAGTPLIKAEGLNAVRALKAEFPDKVIVADMKTMDAGRTEVEYAAKAGAAWSACSAPHPTAPSRSAPRRRATTAAGSSWT